MTWSHLWARGTFYPGSPWNEGSPSIVPEGPGAHWDSRLEEMTEPDPLPPKETGIGVCVQRKSSCGIGALFRGGELGLPVQGIGC